MERQALLSTAFLRVTMCEVMSGHSKWSTIKRQKGVADQKRGQTFTKLANAITIATKLGGSGDPDTNPRLRMIFDEARAANMPKENIQRAIDRGLGKLPGQTIEEVLYEGFGPCRVAFIIEGVTDNKLRTTAEIKNLFDRSGGGIGSVSFMFTRVGEIKVKGKGREKDNEILELIDLGVDEVEEFEDSFLIYVQSPELNTMSNNITQLGFKVESAEIIYKPNITVEISDKEQAKKVLEFTERLEDHDDIQKVYANFDLIE